MKVSREQATENRERVLQTAGTLFREKGFDGVAVADIMKAAGLTHGGFYGQFASKDALVAEACADVMARAAKRWSELSVREDPLATLVGSYLSPQHRDTPGRACALPSLAAEAARSPAPVRAAFTTGLRNFIDILTKYVPGRSKSARRSQALVTMSGLVGAMVLARAVDDAEFSAEILRTAAAAFGKPSGPR